MAIQRLVWETGRGQRQIVNRLPEQDKQAKVKKLGQ